MSIGRIGSVSNEILVHEEDTTNVHGIPDTSILVTTTGTQTLTNKTINGSNNTISNIDQSAITSLVTDLAARAPLASPALTGTPTSTTAAADTNTTQIATTAYVVGQAGTATPVVNGTAAVGTSLRYSRQDHVHGTDTTRAALASPTFTGTPAAPTAAVDTNTTQVATTAYVVGQAGSATPQANGVAAVGTSLRYARQDHVHTMPTAANVGAVASSLVDAKGDLVTATADNTPARLAVGSNGQVLVAASGESTGLIWQGPAEVIGIAVSDEETALTTGNAKVTFRMPFAMTLTAVRASLSTASTSGLPTFDINEGGTSILGTKLSIDANEKTSTTAASAATITDSALADDAEITIDIDVAGTGAKGAKVYLIGRRA